MWNHMIYRTANGAQNFFLYCYFLNIVFFFLLYSMVTQLHIHIYILFSHVIMLHHKWLDIAWEPPYAVGVALEKTKKIK